MHLEKLESDATALVASSVLINVTDVPIARTTIPVSPSISKHWQYLVKKKITIQLRRVLINFNVTVLSCIE